MLGTKKLSEKYVEKLYSIFCEKGWILRENSQYSVFDKFCSRLAELENDVERDLVIELTKDFLWVPSSMYEEYLLAALNKLFESYEWEKEKVIYICPLSPEKDFKKLKSSTFMLYLCQSILMRTYPQFQEGQVRICETPEILQTHKNNIGVLILIDDYIGSGETAIECLQYLNFLRDLEKNIYIVSLVAQEEGISNINKEKVQVFANIVRKKGITDAYPEAEAKEKIETMVKISKQLHAPKGMYLGYANTESLVAMIKTPNNTFPIYWYEHNKSPYAPFARKGNIKVLGDESR